MASKQPESNTPGQPEPFDLIKRGVYKRSVPGVLTFIGLRTLDPIVQYAILSAGDDGVAQRALHALGVSTLAPYALVGADNAAVAGLGLSLPRLLSVAMSAGFVAKQLVYALFTGREEFTPVSALAVSAFNLVLDTANSLLLVASATSAAGPRAWGPRVAVPGTSYALPLPVALGSALCALGLSVELVSEQQRKRFKDRPENAGKICKVGLWRLARHINYGGYTIARAGYALASGGWIAALVVGGFFTYDFATRATVTLGRYLEGRYGEQWRKYKAEVPYKLFPYVY